MYNYSMKKERIISPSEIDKLGNTIIYIAEHTKNLYKTKLLKILYLIEESSVKKYVRPFLNLDFYVWQMGPISKELFVELSNECPTILSDYIYFEKAMGDFGETTRIIPKKDFSDDEFSESDLNLMELIVSQFADKSGKSLVEFTHQPHSLWYQFAEREGLLRDFDLKRINTSDVKIDLSEIYRDNEELKLSYLQAVEEYETIQSLQE